MSDTADLTAALVAIDSVNPSLVPGSAGEGEIARFVAAWARAADLETNVLEATSGRPSVLVRARGRGGGRTLLLCGHLDTVGVEGMRDPHTPRLEGDRLHGRGAYDMKAGVAAALVACRAAAARGLVGDVVVRAGSVLPALGELDGALAERTHPLLGRRSVHASLIRGGEELSSYPARCVVSLERRTLAGEDAPHVESELGNLLDRCRAADPELEAGQRTLLVREPFEVAPDADIVERVRSAAAGQLVAPPPTTGASYRADAAFIAAAGIPTVMFGPGEEGAHAAEEWVSLRDTETVARCLLAVAERLCA